MSWRFTFQPLCAPTFPARWKVNPSCSNFRFHQLDCQGLVASLRSVSAMERGVPKCYVLQAARSSFGFEGRLGQRAELLPKRFDILGIDGGIDEGVQPFGVTDLQQLLGDVFGNVPETAL